jgi:hypothetical protein
MGEISKWRAANLAALGTASLTTLALLYTPMSLGSGAAWAQATGQEGRTSPFSFAFPVTEPSRVTQEGRAFQKPDPSAVALSVRERTPAVQERRAVQKKPDPSPVALSVRAPTPAVQERRAVQRKPQLSSAALPLSETTRGALGIALSSCEKESENSEALILPGAKGDVKLDRCYRGREHLVCSFNALLREATSLIGEYGRIIQAHYPDVNNVAGVCGMKTDVLATDLQKAVEFTNRYRALKAEYDARSSCATRVGQSLKEVTLPDMAQAPEILKSMIDTLEGDLKDVSVAQAKVVVLAERVDSSQKAITTIQKIHRTMCVKDQRAVSQTEDRAIR